ncbi:MAG: TetR/AcrR family transcriptional regulator [Myxococcota bacterium]
MARLRDFDEGHVLECVLDRFWRSGYAGTSLSDLLQATSLSRGSLYQAFTSKRELYVRVLRTYLSEGEQRLRTYFVESTSLIAGLRLWMAAMVSSAGDCDRRGCFAINASVELAPHDAEIREILRAHNERCHAVVRDAIEHALVCGEVLTPVGPDALAMTLMTWVAGLQVAGRSNHDPVAAEASARSLLHLIEECEPNMWREAPREE